MSRKEKPPEPTDDSMLVKEHLVSDLLAQAADPQEPVYPPEPELTDEEKRQLAGEVIVHVEPPADIPVSPSDMADIEIGSVVRFGSAVLRVGKVDETAGTVRFLREGGDPESFYTAGELRLLILARPDPKTQEYEPWPRVVALNPPAKPKAAP